MGSAQAQRNYMTGNLLSKLRELKLLSARIKAEGKPFLSTIFQFLFFYFRYGFTVGNFFDYELYRNDIKLESKLTYLPNKHAEHIWTTLNPASYSSSFTNKYIFHCIAENNSLPVPKFYGIYDKYTGFDNKGRPLRIEKNIQRLINDEKIENLVIKPVEGKQAKHVYALKYDFQNNLFQDLQRGSVTLGDILRVLENEARMKASLYESGVAENYTSFLIQQRLQQDPRLTEMVGPMLAPIRVVTLITNSGEIEILAARIPLLDHRTARDAKDDSLISSAIDLESGRFGDGCYVNTSSNEWVTSIPTANRPFANEICPQWDAVKALARLAASRFAFSRSIGWDIAITPEGPVILEGNTRWGITTLQAAMKKGLYHGELKKAYLQIVSKKTRKLPF